MNKDNFDFSLNGVLPSPDDERDYTAKTVCMTGPERLPKEYRLPYEVPVLNQGCYGSCVAHASAVAMRYGELLNGLDDNDYSRGYIYGNRKESDYQGEGMIIREALSQLNHCGDVTYPEFPYNNTYTWCRNMIEKSKKKLAKGAKKHCITNYFRLTKEKDIKQSLMACGAIIVCVPVYAGFDGVTPDPAKGEEVEGYHALCLVGWDNTGWIFQNSWGSNWGKEGFLHLNYTYPVNEWWGITVKGVSYKTNWLQNLISKIKSFIAK